MSAITYKTYSYRWIVLGVFMLVVAINQLSWITFAAITGDSVRFYGVSDLAIGMLSMSFMIVYILVSFPASWLIDTYGIRAAVGLGAVLTAAFGLLRGFAGANYTLVLIAQIGIAIGQPLILNAVTTVAARWFPPSERATASGLGSLAIYLGIIAGLALTPLLARGSGIPGMLTFYGLVACASAALFFFAARERPPSPPCPPEMEARSLVIDGLRDTLRNRGFLLLMVIFFVGLGAFNAVTTWIEDILKPRGFTSADAGFAGALMIFGGILGAVILPALSDRTRRRVPFILLAILGATLGLAGVTFAGTFRMLLASSFVLGFFLLSAGPIGFQYGAEITYPAPEGTSNGLLLLMGQISGILFIFAMDAFKGPTGAMTPSLVVLLILLLGCALVAARLKEPKFGAAQEGAAAEYARES